MFPRKFGSTSFEIPPRPLRKRRSPADRFERFSMSRRTSLVYFSSPEASSEFHSLGGGKTEIRALPAYQNSISFFLRLSFVVVPEGKVSNAASRWQATGFRTIDTDAMSTDVNTIRPEVTLETVAFRSLFRRKYVRHARSR